MRDTQRARVYKSDRALTEVAKPLPTVRDVERFVKKLMGMKRVQESYPKSARYLMPVVKDGRGRRNAGGWTGGITIPLWARNEAVVLHELAHTICEREHRYDGHAAHGWEFCSIYLKLVLYGMGREAHDVLKAAMKTNRVRFRPKRQMSPEQREAAAQRLAALRPRKPVIDRRFAGLDI